MNRSAVLDPAGFYISKRNTTQDEEQIDMPSISPFLVALHHYQGTDWLSDWLDGWSGNGDDSACEIGKGDKSTLLSPEDIE